MDRVKRFTGRANGASVIPVRKDEDESLVLFGELYKHEKERDTNLLEPMFSVEFEAVQATPLFPSLEMEANSSQMIFQKELPILQAFSSKSDATTASTTSGSPTSSSTKSVTPTARPSSSSSKKNFNRGAAAPSKEQDPTYRIDKRSSYTPLTNRQHNSIPAAPTTTTAATKASKKTSGNKSRPSNAVKNVARPDKAPKNVTETSTKSRSKDSSDGAKDQKVNARRLSGLPAAKRDNVQVTATLKGRNKTVTGVAPATRKDAGTTDSVLNGRREGGKEQRAKLGSLSKK
nr:unnamed protein product [Digitaria exilis]